METGGVALWKTADDQYAAAIKCCEDTLNSLEPSFCSDGSQSGENLFTPRVPLKKYGPNVEVYISRSLKPAAGDGMSSGLGAALATSTPIDAAGNNGYHQNGDGEGFGRSSSPVRGVHFSPVVSEVNWRESYVEQENDVVDGAHGGKHGYGSKAQGGGRRTKKVDVEIVQDPTQKVKVTTTENSDRQAVQKIQVTSVPHPFGQPEPMVATVIATSAPSATLPRSTAWTATVSAGSGARVEPALDSREPTPVVIGKANGHGKKSATLPPKVQLSDGKGSLKANGKSQGSGKQSKKPVEEKGDDHQSIWKRLGIGRLSFGKSGKGSKQVNQKGVSAAEKSGRKEHPPSQEPVQSTPRRPVDSAEVTAIRIELPKTPVKSDQSQPEQELSCEGSERDSTLNPSSSSTASSSSTPLSSTSVASLPPRPPSSSSSTPSSSAPSKHLSPVARARLIAAKKQFLAQQAAAAQADVMSATTTSPSKQPPLTAEEAAKSSENLRQAFERFRQKAEEDRKRLARSVPDLQEVESAVKEQLNAARKGGDRVGIRDGVGDGTSAVPAQLRAEMGKASQEFDKRWAEILAKSEIRKYGTKFERGRQGGRSSFSSDVGGGCRPDSTDAAAGRRQNGGAHLLHYPTAAQYFSDRYRSKSVSGLRDDSLDEDGELDSHEALFLRETHLGRVDAGVDSAVPGVIGGNKLTISPDSALKARSMMNLGERRLVDEEDDGEGGYDVAGRLGSPQRLSPTKGGPGVDDPSRAKSMEFLLDDENKEKIKPPENDLMQADRQMSEHELRFQKSLQRLNVPDWYKKSSINQIGNQRKQSADSTTSASILPRRRGVDRVLPGGWEEAKMASMSSLQSSRAGTPTRGRLARPINEWRYGSSRDNVMSPDSTTSSPVPSEKGLNLGYQPAYYSRWGATGAGRQSGSASPSSQFSAGGLSFISQRSYLSTASTNLGTRKPYLGWRSQEKLAQTEKMLLQNGATDGVKQPLVVRTISNGSDTASCVYLTPTERLARGLMASKQKQQQQQQQQQDHQMKPQPPHRESPSPRQKSASPEKAVESNGLTLSPAEVPELSPRLIRHSIKEVTNAIVHYCSEPEDDVQNQTRKGPSPPRRDSSHRPSEPPPPLPPRKPSLRSMSPDEETPVTVVRHQPRRRLPQWPPPPSASTVTAPKRSLWVESSFVGIKPIASPETPTVGDVVTLFDVSTPGSDDVFGRQVSLDDNQQPDLVPMEKLRTGSAQLNTYFGRTELKKPTVENGELWLQ